jgi:hypothetical protein
MHAQNLFIEAYVKHLNFDNQESWIVKHCLILLEIKAAGSRASGTKMPGLTDTSEDEGQKPGAKRHKRRDENVAIEEA